MKKVGLIGLGAMGSGMAACLRRANFDLYVFDIRSEVSRKFCEAGGKACHSIQELGSICDVVISVVVNAAQTEEVLFGAPSIPGLINSMKSRSVFVMCSTVDPNISISFESRLAEKDILYVDAPISGGAAKAAAGEMTMMTSASSAAYEKVNTILDAMSTPKPQNPKKMKKYK